MSATDLEVYEALKAVAYDQAPVEFWAQVKNQLDQGARLEDAEGIYAEILVNVMAYALAPDTDVAKHGSHNQKDHGRRGGSSLTTLDAGVAKSIVDRVRANGGLSVNMIDGSEPTTGYMVAKGGTKGAIVSSDDFYDPVKGPEALGDFLKTYKEDLTGGSYLGLWHNEADGQVYLDVSDNIMDRATAVAAGRDRNQISIWDVANFEEIDTGGTGKLGKAAEGDQDAGPVDDDRYGDRGVRKDDLGAVHGARTALIAFEPGLRPVLKHGSHDQSTHGRRGGARPEGSMDVQVGYHGLTAKGARNVTEGAAAEGLDMRAVEDHYASRIEAAKTMRDPYRPEMSAYDGGMSWYADANKDAVSVGDGDAAKGAGMISALSPQNPWTSNVTAAHMVADMSKRRDELGLDTPEKAWSYYQANHSAFGKGTKGGCGPVTEPNFAMAWKIANGAPVASTLTGRKRQNFYNNILGDSRSVTIDVHMAKGMSMTPGSRISGKKKAEQFLGKREATTGGVGYTFAAQAVTNVANRLGIEPMQAQAIIWNTYVEVPWPKGEASE